MAESLGYNILPCLEIALGELQEEGNGAKKFLDTPIIFCYFNPYLL
jgi:hypothetical protein